MSSDRVSGLAAKILDRRTRTSSTRAPSLVRVSGVAEKAPAREVEPYDPSAFYDEALDPDGSPRPHYAALMGTLATADLGALERSVTAELDARGVSFRSDEGERAFAVDPIPRIVDAAEWRELELGVRQRARALNAFAADAHADQTIVAAGVVPRRVVEGADHCEPTLRGVAGVETFAPVIGLDIVRDSSGELLVLEDNSAPRRASPTRSPRAPRGRRPAIAPPVERVDPEPSLSALGAAMRCRPGRLDDPSSCC